MDVDIPPPKRSDMPPPRPLWRSTEAANKTLSTIMMIESVVMGQLTRGTITDRSLSESSRISTSGVGLGSVVRRPVKSDHCSAVGPGLFVEGRSKALNTQAPGGVRRQSAIVVGSPTRIALCLACGRSGEEERSLVVGRPANSDHCSGHGCALLRFCLSVRGASLAGIGGTTTAAGFETRRPLVVGVDQAGSFWNSTMAANSSGWRLAPPTRAPSTSGLAMIDATLPDFTEPPYWIRTLSAVASS